MSYNSWSVVYGEQPTASKWNQLGSNDAGFKDGTNIDDQAIIARHLKRDVNGHTILGDNNVRPTRFVPLIPAVSLVNVDPNSVSWADSVDCTAQTSDRTIAIAVTASITSSTTRRFLYARAKGDASTAGSLTLAAPGIASAQNWNDIILPVDSDQIFEWTVSGVDATNVQFILRGYFEYID